MKQPDLNFQKFSYMSLDEVINALAKISKLGPIKSLNKSSNSIGFTLQEVLGIEYSSKNKNNFYGYIINATDRKKSNRTNLFACVPDWKISRLKSSREILDQYGKKHDDNEKYSKSLFCTVDAVHPNSFGLSLICDKSQNQLSECYNGKKDQNEFVVWDTARLNKKLSSLQKTIIVSADTTKVENETFFHYKTAEILSNPNLNSFFELLGVGAITVDHLISLRRETNRCIEQGPLFKLRQSSRPILFDDYMKINLVDY